MIVHLLMKRLRYKHPLPIRILHWISFPVLAIMIWSGLLIYWAWDDSMPGYRIGIGPFTLFRFFPKSFYPALNLDRRLAEGMAWHFAFAWLFALTGLLYVIFTFASGNWRYLLPNRRSFREAWLVTLHDLKLRKEAPPTGKYNGAQQIAYTAVIVMGALSLLTGLAIYKPTQLNWLTQLLGGYAAARWIHFWLTMGYVLFFIVHIAQVIRAGWNNFRAMIAGYELVDETKVRDREDLRDSAALRPGT
jgi:thiosulfate reductase cytochrome b subunit